MADNRSLGSKQAPGAWIFFPPWTLFWFVSMIFVHGCKITVGNPFSTGLVCWGGWVKYRWKGEFHHECRWICYCIALCVYFKMVDFHCSSRLTSTISHSAKRCNMESQWSKAKFGTTRCLKHTLWHTVDYLALPQIETQERKEETKQENDQMGGRNVNGAICDWLTKFSSQKTNGLDVPGGSQGWVRSGSPEECGIQRQKETKGHG